MPTYEEHTLEGPDAPAIEGVVRFEGTLESEDEGTFVVVPDAMAEALDARGRTSVAGTINGQPMRGQVMPYGDGAGRRRWYLGVSREQRTQMGIDVGDTVRVELGRDTEPRTVPVPVELEAALDADQQARAAWEALAPSHRNEHAAYVADAKREETRRRRAEQTVARLRERAAG